VILEALACGRPVVAARAGAFTELVDESVGCSPRPQCRGQGAEAIADIYERDLDAIGAPARAACFRQLTWQAPPHTLQGQFAAYAYASARTAAARRQRDIFGWVRRFLPSR